MGAPVRGLSWRLAALAAVFASWFVAGVAVEVATGKLDRISWWLLFYMLIGLLLVLLWASLAAIRRGSHLATAVVEGALAGAAAPIVARGIHIWRAHRCQSRSWIPIFALPRILWVSYEPLGFSAHRPSTPANTPSSAPAVADPPKRNKSD